MTGKQLKAARVKNRISQKLFAEVSGWLPSYVSTLEHLPKVSRKQSDRYLSSLQAAVSRFVEIQESEERADREALSRFQVPSKTPAPPKAPTPLEVHQRNQVPAAPTPAAILSNPPPPPKSPTQTYETMKGLLAGLGIPEVRDGFVSYTLPSRRGFLLVWADRWSLRVYLIAGQAPVVYEGQDFDELVVRLRALRLLGA